MMNFVPANRAETPDTLQAAYQQAQIAAQLRQASQARKQMLGEAGVQFAGMAPEGSWANLGNAIMGNSGNVVTPVVADATTGALASSAPVAANSTAALLGAETAAGAGAAASAAPGITGALSALGPMGWAALLAGGLLARDSF